ncbi:phasin family protein [Chromobacterium violaceum]|uniref:Phasin n=2 Tax=Chromobacterium violaceum TaxID=536 RepID=A0A1R0MBS0_CHRVL|nr:phasin family protein [Chromobacterium violaceum]AAQ59041.1 probable phasin [Chromobacterium violaceum ATCC 12472]ATP28032.1 phasin [Chromobacterium violaceum]ATP31942.1 phasin [Chromobacterium violaceum]KJH67271.1 phasin [Chromobacterium violaceum]KMN48392.1 phasin [Chromobacterium violaceum]
MSYNNEQLNKLSLTGIESTLRFAQIALDSTERLIKLQLEASKQSLEDHTKAAKQLTEFKDSQEAINHLNKLATQSVDKLVSHSRNLYEVVSGAQSELSKLVEDSVGQFNKSLISSIESVAKNAPAGSDATLNAVKTSVAAAAAAVNTFSKAAQQVAEFTDSSVKAATSATADAVKNSAKRGATV